MDFDEMMCIYRIRFQSSSNTIATSKGSNACNIYTNAS